MATIAVPQLNKAFASEDSFRQRTGKDYALLPLRFLPLDEDRYVATNFAGEYIVLTRPDLQALIRHELRPQGGLYDALKAKHFVLDGDSSVAIDLLACKYRTKHSLLSKLTSLFLFVVTLRCEHSCPYCQVSRQSQDRHAFDMRRCDAERAIDFVFSSPSEHIKVEFQGGEPLLNFDLVRWVVDQVLERNETARKQIAFVIATNLALIDDGILAFCKAHDIFISTSLDGPRELHNANRPRPGHDSYERTIEGIAQVRAALGADRVAALMTTTRASLSQPESIVDEYVRQGFSSLFLRALSPFGFAVKTGAIDGYTIDEWLAFYRRALAHILRLNKQGVAFREEYAALLLRKMLTPYPTGYVDLQSPAGIGLSCIAFNYDGSIYASDEARMLAEMGDYTFRLGRLVSDTFESVIGSPRLLDCLAASMSESAPMCADCGVQPYCGSDPVFHYATQGDMVGRKTTSGFCRKNMEIIKHLVRLLEDDREASSILRSWIR